MPRSAPKDKTAPAKRRKALECPPAKRQKVSAKSPAKRPKATANSPAKRQKTVANPPAQRRKRRPPPPTTFEPFPRLPPELRHEIWLLALPPTDRAARVCLLPPYLTSLSRVRLPVRRPRTALDAACAESRAIARDELGPAVRVFDPDADTLYVSSEGFAGFCRMCAGSALLKRVRHLAVELCVADSGYLEWRQFEPRLPMGHLSALDTLSIVYPRAVGEALFFERVVVPEGRSPELREFTDRELKKFVIHAKYMVDRDNEITWSKTAKKHIGHIETRLATRPGKPRVEARCFVQDDATKKGKSGNSKQ